jgi:hypothetical protein
METIIFHNHMTPQAWHIMIKESLWLADFEFAIPEIN